MKRPAALATVIGFFLVGIVVGGLATHLYYVDNLRRPGGPPAMAARHFGERLERQLDLTPEQRLQIDAIIRESHDEAKELRRQLHPRVMEQMRLTHERIEAVLTPEQRKMFQDLRRRHRRLSEQFFLGP